MLEVLYISEQVERYKISGNTNFIILQKNILMTAGNKGKVKKGKWKLLEGELRDAKLLMRIIDEIEYSNR